MSDDLDSRQSRREPTAASTADEDAAIWEAVGRSWVASGRQRIWRRHSDHITGDLLCRWLRPGSGASLKTDLFDEALSDGLYEIMSAYSHTVHGIDLSVATARAARTRHPGMAVRVADIRDLPYPDETFETVISLSTLDHFDSTRDIERSLGEIRRVTAPRGRLVLSLDNPLNPKIALRARLNERLMRKTGLVPYHCGVTLRPAAMREAVERAGYRVLERTAIVHCPRVSAVWLGGLIERASLPGLAPAFLAALHPFELLERLPTRYLTGHFSALLAEVRD